MLTTKPRLRIHRPSPTTAEFTVTTQPPPTIGLHVLRIVLFLLRISLSLTTVLVLHAKWVLCPWATQTSSASPTLPDDVLSFDTFWYVLDTFDRSPTGLALIRLASALPIPFLLPAAAALFYVLSLRIYSRESLLVLRGLGVQTSESSGTYLAGTATRFIPTEKIRDIFVNEAFRGFEVRHYLVVVVEGEEDVVVVFPGLLPKRRIVEVVWRGVRDCLYEGREEKKGEERI